MANLSFNGTVFDGTPVANPTHPYKPDTLARDVLKIGKTVITANGQHIFIARGISKCVLTIGWKTTNETTRAALRALHAVTTTWTFIDQLSASYVVETEESSDYHETYVLTDRSNNLYYDCTIILHEV